jgi:hypothetical protein
MAGAVKQAAAPKVTQTTVSKGTGSPGTIEQLGINASEVLDAPTTAVESGVKALKGENANPPVLKEGEGTVKEVAKAVSGTAELFEDLTNPKTWIRVAEVLAGGALILFGLVTLAKATAGGGGAGAHVVPVPV